MAEKGYGCEVRFLRAASAAQGGLLARVLGGSEEFASAPFRALLHFVQILVAFSYAGELQSLC